VRQGVTGRCGRSPIVFLITLIGLGAGAAPAPIVAQTTLARSPNIEGFWAPQTGVVQFNFNHRFHVTGPPLRKVLNTPTLMLATGLPGGAVVGTRYATNSLLVSARPNEWELFGRWSPWREERGSPVDVGLQVAHNGPAGGVDGELLVGRTVGPVRAVGGARAFSSFRGAGGEVAVVGGLVVLLGRYVALAADVANLVGDGGTGEGTVAWSGGLQVEIPYTPHSMSLHVSNANATTLQSATVGTPDRRWGFEFTVPLTLRRYLGAGGPPPRRAPAVVDGADAVPGAGEAEDEGEEGGDGEEGEATVEMDNLMRFLPDTVRVKVGERVRWRNTSDIVHTVTADPTRAELGGSVRLPEGAPGFDSGDLRPGEEFVHVFMHAGEYVYFCVPHERAGMIGVVRVENP
jgi:plastocyanin